MQTGAITSYIDVAQLALYGFWIFFAGLIYYLRTEDKREGYPLVSDRLSNRVKVQGFPPVPRPKVFRLAHGGIQTAPRIEPKAPPPAAVPIGPWPGAPLTPTGNPLVDHVGPASAVDRADVPELGWDDHAPRLRPLRVLNGAWRIESRDPDPRGMPVIARDGKVAGTVTDVWVDTGETIIRYLEVAVPVAEGTRTVLVPMPLARVQREAKVVKVISVDAWNFAEAPTLRNPDVVTLREEDRISGYFGGGHLYATADRMGPLL
jgi:photosynthetic reaction center H subunit